jgi:glycine/D-amino acid oxidase-like deaminating enzyme
LPDPEGPVPHQPPAIEWLDLDQVAELVPGLAQPMAGALVRHQARVNPLRALARMAAVLPAVATGVAATAVTMRAGRVVSVSTTAGEVHPGAVVFATGSPPLLDGLHLNMPSELVKGHLLVTEPAPLRLPGTVAPVATQLEDGRLLVGGTFDVGDQSPQVDEDVIDSILEGLYASLPTLRGLRAAYQWCCFRPRHPDGHPVIDRIPGLDNAWLTSGHYRTGILLAPVTAQAIARWIATDEPPSEVLAWSGDRFAAHRFSDC